MANLAFDKGVLQRSHFSNRFERPGVAKDDLFSIWGPFGQTSVYE